MTPDEEIVKLDSIVDALHARIAELTARAEFAERERDENLLKSGDITCMETDRPGCGLCTLCLGAERDLALARAATLAAEFKTAEIRAEYHCARAAAAEHVMDQLRTALLPFEQGTKLFLVMRDARRERGVIDAANHPCMFHNITLADVERIADALDAARRATTAAPAPKVNDAE